MSNKLLIFTFFINGISSILGYNTMLNSLDYFAQRFSDFNVYLAYPIPYAVACCITSLMYNQIHKKISCKNMIIFGIILNLLSLIGLLVASIFFQDSLVGFILSLFFSGMIGLTGNVSELSFYSIVNYISEDIVSILMVGVSLSGLIITIIRMIILSIKGSDSGDMSAIITYYIVTISVSVLDLVLNIGFFSSELCKEKFSPYEYANMEIKVTQKLEIAQSKQNKNNQSYDNNQQTSSRRNSLVTKSFFQDIDKNNGYFSNLNKAHKQISPIDYITYFNYIQTFILFPALTLSRKSSWGGAWPTIILLFCFGLGDTLGRIFSSFRKLYNKESLIYIFICRFFFFWSISVLSKNIDDSFLNSDIFAFVNQFIFGLSNGIVTNGNFVLIFQLATLHNKLYAGLLFGIMIQFGIVSGTILAYPFNFLVNKI